MPNNGKNQPQKLRQATTLLLFLDEVPPFVASVVASPRRLRGQPFRRYTHKDVARRSGLTLRTTQRIAQKLSWKNVRVEDASAYLYGCGISPFPFGKSRQRLLERLNQLEAENYRHLDAVQRRVFFQKIQRLNAIKASEAEPNRSQDEQSTNPRR